MNEKELPDIIYPGEPGYEEAKKDLVNIPGNKPIKFKEGLNKN